MIAPTAHADENCQLIRGRARELCERGNGAGSGSNTPDDVTNPLDPLSSLAQGFAKAAAWVVDQLSNAVKATADVDFTNGSFLKTYSLVFAASTFLTIVVWLWAVVKRAVRGVPLTTAIGEAVGLLWLTVIASAFTPLILYTVVSAVDGITEALVGTGNTSFFNAFSSALEKDNPGGGPIAQIILACVAILAAGVVWIELVARAALLYVGAALGTVVYSGLVDKKLWDRVKKWLGLMIAIILVKPVIVIVLRLASAMTSGGPKEGDTTAAIISGLSIILIAIFASAMLFRLIPGMGDDIVSMRREAYDPSSRASSAAVTRPVSGVRQGINTHASRDSAARPATASPSTSASSSPGGGISAHATRPTRSAPTGPSPANRMPRQNDDSGSPKK
ncbi:MULTISPECIES: hypothetical protein [unclassified Streptomyces]|uniref:hypothetical protein n=1 Tax=unclassified Streptomyces TaxID=2593676 RepID=UPI00278BD28D|nr:MULTISPECIES: hypothetical protein [unclassified Streptomyces]